MKRFFNFNVMILLALALMPVSGCYDEGFEKDGEIKPSSNAKEITAFSFKAEDNTGVLSVDVEGEIVATTIIITVPHGTETKNLKAAFTYTGAAVTVDGETQESGITGNNFETSRIIYTVIAEDGTTEHYTVIAANGEMTEEQSVAAAINDLEISAFLNGNTSADSITRDLSLPGDEKYGTTFEWVSDNTSVINPLNGIVSRPVYADGDIVVRLYARVTKGTETRNSATFTFIVKRNDVTPEESVDEAWDDLTESDLLNGNSSSTNVISDLYLPKTGVFGTTISWTSTASSVINPGTGKVSRPAYNYSNAAVTLTATVSKSGSSSRNKTFSFTVIKQEITDTEAVTAALNDLDYNDILRGNSANAVTSSLTLPSTGIYSTSIFWRSSNSTIVDPANGAVTRPSYGSGNTSVTLTAVVYKGSGAQQVQQEKQFSVIVLRQEPVTVTDPNESDVPDWQDFKSITHYIDNNSLVVDVVFYGNPDLDRFSFYVKRSSTTYFIECKLNEFQVKTGSSGYFNILRYTGTPVVSGTNYHLEFPLSALGLDEANSFSVMYWLYCMESKDQLGHYSTNKLYITN
ncbi:MAG: hypothetical protein GY754_44365 [bacterium]|nr:hypothetical protein [bacterium]